MITNINKCVDKFNLFLFLSIIILSPLLSTWKVQYRGSILISLPLLALVIIFIRSMKRKNIQFSYIHLFSLLFLLLYLISSVFSPEKELSIIWFSYTLSWISIYFLANSFKDQKNSVLKFYMLPVFLVIIYSLWQFFIIFPETIKYFNENPELLNNFTSQIINPRLYGTFQYSNSLAAFFILSTGIIWQTAVSLFNNPLNLKNIKNKNSILFFFLIFVNLLVSILIWLTSSRVGVIVWILEILLLSALVLKKYNKLILVITLSSVIGSSLSFIISQNRSSSGGFESITARDISVSRTYSSKIETFQGSLAMTVNHPFIGTGPGTFSHNYSRFRPENQHDLPSSAHNILLEISSTVGLPAALVFTLLLIMILFSIRLNPVIFISSAAFLFHSMVDWNFKNIGLSFIFFSITGLYSNFKLLKFKKNISFSILTTLSILFTLYLLFVTIRSATGGFNFIKADREFRYNSYQSSRILFQRAIKINPYRAQYYFKAAFVQKDFYAVLKYFKRASALAPDWYEPYYHLSKVSFLLGDSANGMLYLHKAQELFPNSDEIKSLSDSF